MSPTWSVRRFVVIVEQRHPGAIVSGRYFLDVCEATCSNRTPLPAVMSTKFPGVSCASCQAPALAKHRKQKTPSTPRPRQDRINQFMINVIQPPMLKGTALKAIGMIVVLAVPAIGGDRRCADCHPKEVQGYRQSAMAHSLSEVTPQPEGSFEHALSKTRFSIRSNPSGVLQRFQRDGESGEQRVAYVIGSGAHAFGYLVRIGDRLFQSPLSYYTNRRLWDVAPGYEESHHPDFSRPVTLECLLCHSGKAQPVPDTLNRYQTPAFLAESITCDRCHGPGEAHANKPVPGSILNPAKLRGAARDS